MRTVRGITIPYDGVEYEPRMSFATVGSERIEPELIEISEAKVWAHVQGIIDPRNK